MNARTAAYRARLQERLERAQVDAEYAALRARAGMPYDQSPEWREGFVRGAKARALYDQSVSGARQSPRAAFEQMEPYRALAERMARQEWGDALLAYNIGHKIVQREMT